MFDINQYEWRIELKDTAHKIYHLQLWSKKFHEPHILTSVKYQAWGFGSCSMANVWGFSNVPANESLLALFIRDALLPMHDEQDWQTQRIFVQVPAGGFYNDYDEQYEIGFFKLLRETIFPDLQPAYVFENKSHKSTEQRLFDLSIPEMREWMENYYAEQGTPNVGNGSSDAGTIIAEPSFEHDFDLF